MKIKKNYQETAKNKYRELSEEEKNIKREYGKKRYHNMSEENKKKLKEYQKNYREAKNMLHKCRCVSKNVLRIYIFSFFY